MDSRWLAGFFDGEGTATLIFVPQKGYGKVLVQPHIGITQRDKKILMKIREKLGFGKIYFCNGVPVLKTRNSSEIDQFIKLIKPHTVLKKKHLEILKKVLSITKGHRKGVPYKKGELHHLLNLHEEMRRLNNSPRNIKHRRFSIQSLRKCIKGEDKRK